MKSLVLLACLALPSAAFASPLAILSERSGMVAPQYAWSYDVVFEPDGAVDLTYCKGYQTEGPACAKGQAQLAPADLAALEAALAPVAADFAAHPAPENPNPPIGGGAVWATFTVAGQQAALPAFPLPADAERVEAALAILRAALPESELAAAEKAAVQP